MACDLPEHYMVDGKVHPAFQFITDVGVDWQQSKVLDGEVGDHVTIARKERETGNWFVGGIADENARELRSSLLIFLKKDKPIKLKFIKMAPDAHWDRNPTALEIEQLEVTSNSNILVKLAEGGGFAMSIIK
jgi:hypothetical protein